MRVINLKNGSVVGDAAVRAKVEWREVCFAYYLSTTVPVCHRRS